VSPNSHLRPFRVHANNERPFRELQVAAKNRDLSIFGPNFTTNFHRDYRHLDNQLDKILTQAATHVSWQMNNWDITKPGGLDLNSPLDYFIQRRFGADPWKEEFPKPTYLDDVVLEEASERWIELVAPVSVRSIEGDAMED
jgi:hypothetical protein